MKVEFCPKCGSPMNVAFALFEKKDRKVHIQCPKCKLITETLPLPDDEVVETRAGIEGIEAMVMPV